MQQAEAFRYIDGHLYCDEVPLDQIAETVGTPCYVYSRDGIVRNLSRLRTALEPIAPTLCYAVKANSNLSILRLLAAADCHFDIVSEGEFRRLRQVGVPPSRILYSGVGKTERELRLAIESAIHCLVIESVAEAETLSRLTRDLDRPLQVSLRVNPDVEVATHPYISTGLRRHKFGIDFDHVPDVLAIVKRSPRLRLRGIGSHIGSQILDPAPFVAAFRKIRSLAHDIDQQGFALEHLDLGGGFGIPYQGEPPIELGRLAQELAREKGKYQLLFEPGRYLVGNAGALLTEVCLLKTNHDKSFVVVDAAMNDLIRPTLYSAYHEIRPLVDAPAVTTADIVGPVCETADFLARDRLLPTLQTGDRLAVLNAGAYGFVASSNYNSRPRAAEVLVETDSFRTIRRRETFDELIRGER